MIYESLWFIKSVYHLTGFRVPQEGGNWTFGIFIFWMGGQLSRWLSKYVLWGPYFHSSLSYLAEHKSHTLFLYSGNFAQPTKESRTSKEDDWCGCSNVRGAIGWAQSWYQGKTSFSFLPFFLPSGTEAADLHNSWPHLIYWTQDLPFSNLALFHVPFLCKWYCHLSRCPIWKP